jgi:hypothetical protein
MSLCEEPERLPFKLISRHVKSFQDDEREFVDHTRPKQLNELADHHVTAALISFVRRGKPQRYITSREICTLRTAHPENELRVYLQHRNGWSNKTYKSINWFAYSSVSAGLTDNALTFVGQT